MDKALPIVLSQLHRREAQFIALRVLCAVFPHPLQQRQHKANAVSARRLYQALQYVCLRPDTTSALCALCGNQLKLKKAPIWTWPVLWPYKTPQGHSAMPLCITPHTPNTCFACIERRVRLITLSQACKKYTLSIPDCLRRIEWKIKYRSKVLVAPEKFVRALSSHYSDLLSPLNFRSTLSSLVYPPVYYNAFRHQESINSPQLLRLVSLRHTLTFKAQLVHNAPLWSFTISSETCTAPLTTLIKSTSMTQPQCSARRGRCGSATQ